MEIINAVGRRKTAVARAFVQTGNGKITINKRDFENYFPVESLQQIVRKPLELTDNVDKFDIHVNIDGGGITGQAEALRLAISRAIIKIDPEHRAILKSNGFLMRDPRMVERKKPGQKKARKKFQFSKR
ncbi:MAG: 30S ribosomal protein S9 [Bacteroidales bacterium]|jgi:small subunit ribosomal protein S9|nr:30S ribosomal protein S9 [Bacteroidales bacterium]MDI9592376.1 30S ribosomal protein S9 [Bacteroidota bacterium]NLH33717.1 30S ribosomal protein S9 [Lentimicrobium sp.]OQC37103.1 MAG: 30S ribosomal protein S9 [Bacteroidetes bacterium ADurb.Bin041]MBP7875148.1 30S ribosomal protein S9 [Bacteroidales bacterium]